VFLCASTDLGTNYLTINLDEDTDPTPTGSSAEDPLADPSVAMNSGSDEQEQATMGSLASAGSPGGHAGMTGELCSSMQALIPNILPLT
jgi:hypothetical protein